MQQLFCTQASASRFIKILKHFFKALFMEVAVEGIYSTVGAMDALVANVDIDAEERVRNPAVAKASRVGEE
jgi:hypothetical protein